jgi:hypothetical protein
MNNKTHDILDINLHFQNIPMGNFPHTGCYHTEDENLKNNIIRKKVFFFLIKFIIKKIIIFTFTIYTLIKTQP